MMAPPAAVSVPLIPGPVPPPVAGAPAGALVVAAGVAEVVAPVGASVGGLPVVAVPVGVLPVVAVELVAGVATAATAPADGPISISIANEATSHAAPVTTANLPSFGTTGQSLRRD